MQDFGAAAARALPERNDRGLSWKEARARRPGAPASPPVDLFAMQAAGGTPDDLKAYIKLELEKWAPIIKAAKIEM